jgi:hypothetical protein
MLVVRETCKYIGGHDKLSFNKKHCIKDSKRMFLANMKIGLGRKLYICCGRVHLLKRDVGIERGEILSPNFLAFFL